MKLKTIAILSFFLLQVSFGFATNWYVSPAGTNTASSGTLANPFRTITYASSSLNAGDTLFVRGGTYTNAGYGNGDYWKMEQTARISGRNGNAAAYIVIMPYGNEKPVIKCDGQFAFQVLGSSYLKILGLEIYGETENIALQLAKDYQFAFRRNTNTSATTIEYRCPPGTTTYQTNLEDLSAYTIYRPFYFFTHGMIVQNSHHVEVLNNRVHHMPGEGIRFAGPMEYVVCAGNEVYENSRRSATGVHGISCYSLTSTDTYDGVKVLFARNKVFNNYNEVASWSEQKTEFNPAIDEGKGLTVQRTYTANGWEHGRIRFENNIAYGNGLSGLHVNTGDRIDMVNNTVYNNNRYGTGNNLGISLQSANDCRIYNNIVVSNLAWGGYTIAQSNNTSGTVVSNNLINGGLDAAIKAIDVNTITADPLFVDAANNNFLLQAGSAAINSSLVAEAPAVDYSSNNRDGQPDRGALEFVTTLPVKFLHINALKQGSAVMIQWQVGQEVNTKQYQLQRFAGALGWATIGQVNASGAAGYQFADAYPQIGYNQYRVLAIDHDTRSFCSATVALQFGATAGIKVYPNPFTETIRIDGVNANAGIRLFALNGADVTPQTSMQVSGSQVVIRMQSLPPAVYALYVNNQVQLITKTK